MTNMHIFLALTLSIGLSGERPMDVSPRRSVIMQPERGHVQHRPVEVPLPARVPYPIHSPEWNSYVQGWCEGYVDAVLQRFC